MLAPLDLGKLAPPSDVAKAAKSKRSKKSKKSKKTRKPDKRSLASDGNSSGKYRSQSSSSRKKSKKSKDGRGEGKTFLHLSDWEARNVKCQVCGCRDSDADPVFAPKKMLWGYPPTVCKKTNKWTTSGLACFYCARVQQAAYYPRIKIKDMKQKVGEDPVLHKDLLSS